MDNINMPYSIYVLRSLSTNKRYIGYSSKNSKIRLEEHNLGSNKWTKTNRPWILIYEEEFKNRTEAIKRENFLKSGQGRKWLDNHIPG